MLVSVLLQKQNIEGIRQVIPLRGVGTHLLKEANPMALLVVESTSKRAQIVYTIDLEEGN